MLGWGLGGGWWCPLPRLQWGLRPCKTHAVPCLLQYDWYTKHTSTVLEVVPRQTWGEYSPGSGGGCTGRC